MKSILRILLICAFVLPLAAQDFKVTLLGTGAPIPSIVRFGPSILVEAGSQRLLFDAGRGATQRLQQIKVPLPTLTAVFFTHLHSDHVVGFPDVWLTGWLMGRKTPLFVYGPAGTSQMTTHLTEAYAFDIHIRRDVDEAFSPDGVVLNAKDIEQGIVYQKDGVKVTAFTVDHAAVKPALGYRIDYAGHSVTLSGDTRFSENLIRFAAGSDVLIHEVINPLVFGEPGSLSEARKRIIDHHTTPEQAGIVFKRVAPKLAVYSHIVPPDAGDLITTTRKTYDGPLEVGEDLMSINIGDKVTVKRP
jgi:ribonuclease Z